MAVAVAVRVAVAVGLTVLVLMVGRSLDPGIVGHLHQRSTQAEGDDPDSGALVTFQALGIVIDDPDPAEYVTPEYARGYADGVVASESAID